MEGFDKLTPQLAKHEAIVKAKSMLGVEPKRSKQQPQAKEELSRVAVLTKVFDYYKRGLTSCRAAQEYMYKRCLNPSKLEVGYNSAQFHYVHRDKKDLIASCKSLGLLIESGGKSRTGKTAFSSFGRYGLVFPLRNKEGQLVSLYFRSTKNDTNQRHFYLKDRQGLYPSYPSKETRKLILTESIIDAASLLQQSEITKECSVLALYGTNGLTAEHRAAIKSLADLAEIIFFFDGDEAGRESVAKYAAMLKIEYPNIKISHVETPENEDVNSLLQSHSCAILSHLIRERKECASINSTEDKLIFSSEAAAQRVENLHINDKKGAKDGIRTPGELEQKKEVVQSSLDSSNPNNLKYSSGQLSYQIKGFRVSQPDSLKVTINIAKG